MRKVVEINKELYKDLLGVRSSLGNEQPLLSLVNDCIAAYEKSQRKYRESDFFEEGKSLLTCRPINVTREQLSLIGNGILPETLVCQLR